MVEHIVDKTREVMKDTKYENDFYFYHDALSQTTCRKTTAWMIMTGYINHWILLSSGVNSGTIYAKRPPGDSPEFMPLDTSLLGDAHACVKRHVMITEAFSESDVNTFSLLTPRRVASVYLRILNPVSGGSPSSTRILQDCKKWITSLELVRNARGAIVEGVGNRIGHRALNVPRFSWGGGKRIKQPPKPMKWLHIHAKRCVEGMVQESIKTVDKKINGERELTIVDPPENSEEVQAQLNATARSAEEEAE
jgi:hypothetical protein